MFTSPDFGFQIILHDDELILPIYAWICFAALESSQNQNCGMHICWQIMKVPDIHRYGSMKCDNSSCLVAQSRFV